jgi:hypothetical protein
VKSDLQAEVDRLKQENREVATERGALKRQLLEATEAIDGRIARKVRTMDVSFDTALSTGKMLSFIAFWMLAFYTSAAGLYTAFVGDWSDLVHYAFSWHILLYCAACAVILLQVHLFVNVFCKWQHRYTFRKFWAIDHGVRDVRADIIALRDVKHHARYAKFLYRQSLKLFGFEIWSQRERKMYASLELLAQLTVSANLCDGSPDWVAALRIQTAGKTIQTINYSKYLALEGKMIVQDSCKIAFALHKEYQHRSSCIPFPLAPA